MATSRTITVTGTAYNLQVTIGGAPEQIISFVFTLYGDDAKQYHLQDAGTKKRAAMIQRLFARLGDAWPDGSVTVAADADTRIITDVP